MNSLATRTLSCWLVAASTLLASSASVSLAAAADKSEEKAPASAEAGVMVRPFTGARSDKIHEDTVKALEQAGVTLVPAGFEADVELGDSEEPYVGVAQKHNIKAFVHGKVTMSKRGWVLQLTVRNGKDGKVTEEPKLRAAWLPGLLKKIDTNLADALHGPLSKTEAPEPLPEPEPEPDPAEADFEEEEADTGARPSPLDLNLGLGLMYRDATYTDGIVDSQGHALQPPNVGPLTIRAGAHWYPGAHFTGGLAANIGLALGFFQSFGGITEMLDAAGQPQEFTTVYSELNIGLRGRFQLEMLELGLNVGWGRADLTIEGDNEVPVGSPPGTPVDMGVVPDADYSYFRFGPDVRMPVGPVEVGLGAFYRAVTLGDEPGQWKEPRWFPNATADALEVSLSALLPITDTIGVSLTGELRQYGLSMNTEASALATSPPSESIAGGASDTYTGVFASVQFKLPGSDGPGGEPEPEQDDSEDGGDDEASFEVSTDGD